MAFTIVEILDLGDDVLLVRATTDDDETVEAHGWVSATTNHYDDDQYDGYTEKDVAKKSLPIGSVGRHLKPDAKARPMTPGEVGEYARRLVTEQHPHAAAVAEPTPISFE